MKKVVILILVGYTYDMERTKKYVVYRHVSPSGKSYIGITCQKPEIRWRKGKGYFEYNPNKMQFNVHFINAIKKYGWDNFKHEILCSDLTLEEAQEKEKYFISFYDSFKNGYNATTGGEGAPLHKMSEESKEQMRKKLIGRKTWNKGIPCSEEMKKRLREINLGRKDSPEVCRKKALAVKRRKNYFVSEETRKKLSESHMGQPGYWTGKKRSKETIEKIKKSLAKNKKPGYWTGKKRSKETIEKMSLANKGKKMSEETRKKISEGLKRSYESGRRKRTKK